MDINKLGNWTFNLIEHGKTVETKTVEYTGINECFGLKFETTFSTWMNDMLYIFWELQKRNEHYDYAGEKFMVTVDDNSHRIDARLIWLKLK